jgi:hypothetical protein
MNLSISLTDLMLNFCYVAALFSKVYENQLSCHVTGFLIQMLNAISVLILLCLALYQYWIIVCFKPHISNQTCVILLSAIAVAGILISSMPYWDGTNELTKAAAMSFNPPRSGVAYPSCRANHWTWPLCG